MKNNKPWLIVIAVALTIGLLIFVSSSREITFLKMVSTGSTSDFSSYLRKGGDPNLQFSPPFTGRKSRQRLLHFAVDCYNIDACRLLVQNGANPNLADYNGWTPIMCATRLDKDPITSDKIFKYLLPISDLSLVDDGGRTLLHIIAEYGNEKQYEVVLSKAPWLVAEEDYCGRTPPDILRRKERRAAGIHD